MFGLIHVILKDLVLSKFGADTWSAVLAELGADDDAGILELKQYPDETTIAGVRAAAKVLGVSWDDALKVFGAHFVAFVERGGHLRMLESMGDNLKEFMRNLNHMHTHLERQMREAHFPCFHISDEAEDGTFHPSYGSERGLALKSLVEGILPAVAGALHGQDVKMEVLSSPEEGYDVTWLVRTKKATRLSTLRRAEEDGIPNEVDDDCEAVPSVVSPSVKLPQITRVADDPAVKYGCLWHAAVVSCCSCRSTKLDGSVHGERIDARASDPDSDMLQEDLAVSWEYSESVTEYFSEAEHSLSRQATAEDEARKSLDMLAVQAKLASDPADVLMRALPYHYVCAGWDDPEQLNSVAEFWGTSAGELQHFNWTRASQAGDRFISHSWFQPENWLEVMGSRCHYAEMKGTELHAVVMEIADLEERDHEDITFWIDKCCIPQQHSLMPFCIGLIEDFLDRCEGMIVLLQWQYFQRLWCVYEWAAFLVRHPPQNITICMSAFMRPASRGLYIESIRRLTMDNCKCAVESDRDILKRKVAEYYYSERDFENFARCTALAMIARTLCREASRGKAAFDTEFAPFVSLAEELGLAELARALELAEPVRWRSESKQALCVVSAGKGAAMRDWQCRFLSRVEEWFADEVAPILTKVKLASVRPGFVKVSDTRPIVGSSRISPPFVVDFAQ